MRKRATAAAVAAAVAALILEIQSSLRNFIWTFLSLDIVARCLVLEKKEKEKKKIATRSNCTGTQTIS